MPPLTLSVCGRLYEVICEDNQVDHLRKMAAQIDERALNLTSAIGTQPEARLLLMVALTLADELAEQKSETVKAEAGLGNIAVSEELIVQTLSDLTGRIESIAQRLERS